jgi:hypothetical protein
MNDSRRIIGVLCLLVFLTACTGEDTTPAASATPTDLVDDCYQEQAALYKEAAELAQNGIQTHVPAMIESFTVVLEGSSLRDTETMEMGRRQFMRASNDMQGVGGEFSSKMDEAAAACS